jgi:hypothetical protein
MAKVPVPSFQRGMRLLATLAWLPTIMLALALNRKGFSLVSDYAFGLVTLAFLWVLLSARMAADKDAIWVRFSRLLARFSYTLYATHTPPMFVIAALLLGPVRWNVDMAHVALGLCIAMGLTLYALLLATFTEFRTDSVRNWVERKLDPSRDTVPTT